MAVLLIFASTTRNALATPDEVLTGVNAFTVIGLADDDSKAVGIQESDIESIAETALRKSGIGISTPDADSLWIDICALKTSDNNAIVYVIKVEYCCPLKKRNDIVIATIWSTMSYGITPINVAKEQIRNCVKDVVDRFINAHAKANGTKHKESK